ncbi:TetR/AcrR family transcriptional regulator C-terminal domain-containing protein [Staphylococcus epidermidis]|nr:TetR/AcrR family transcriptional regulator C-terminal domain-containing protein [Staphylococcus epidermidis]
MCQKRTFYEHFNDKYEVVELLIEDYIAQFKYSIDTLKVQNDFRTNLILGFKYLYENSNIFIILYNSSLSRLFLKRIKSLIKKLIREQINRSYLQQQNISEETILTFLSHAVIGIMIDIGIKRDIQYLEKVDEIMHIIIPYFKSQNN